MPQDLVSRCVTHLDELRNIRPGEVVVIEDPLVLLDTTTYPFEQAVTLTAITLLYPEADLSPRGNRVVVETEVGQFSVQPDGGYTLVAPDGLFITSAESAMVKKSFDRQEILAALGSTARQYLAQIWLNLGYKIAVYMAEDPIHRLCVSYGAEGAHIKTEQPPERLPEYIAAKVGETPYRLMGVFTGEAVIDQMIPLFQILKCPYKIIQTDHYRADSTCRCDDRTDTRMQECGYGWDAGQGCWVYPESTIHNSPGWSGTGVSAQIPSADLIPHSSTHFSMQESNG